MDELRIFSLIMISQNIADIDFKLFYVKFFGVFFSIKRGFGGILELITWSH